MVCGLSPYDEPMSDAAYALLGVAIGALIPGLTAMYAARQTRLNGEAERQEKRDERLFELRRIAYVEFAAAVERLQERARTSKLMLKDADSETYMAVFEPIVKAGSAVTMLGTKETANAVSKVVSCMWDYLHEVPEARAGLVLSGSIREFSEAARRDLGARS